MSICRIKVKSINRLLIVLTLLQYAALFVVAIDLRRSSSSADLAQGPNDNGFRERVQDPLKYADDSLITRTGKSNKVSKLLRMIHNKAADVIYHRGQTDQPPKILAPLLDNSHEAKSKLDQLSNDEVISSVCGNNTRRRCRMAVGVALKLYPDEKSVIANAIRHKPIDVDASKLLYHKLFESAIAKAEKSGIDEKIDYGINLLAKKSPYGWAATKALDLAAQRM